LNLREYAIPVMINGIMVNRFSLIHIMKKKHAGTVTDEIILEWVKTLNGLEIEPVKVDEPFSYFESDRIEYRGKSYKLIWLLEMGQRYIGIVNAYRR
jgi:hypothetical protein